MALYHFSADQISRGDGQSSVASAAYRAGEKLTDEYYGQIHDYTRKGGVIMSEIILPPHAPERFADRETLWNEVEKVEKHPKAQLAYSFDFALQNELSMDENIRIAKEFIAENFTSRGMIVDMAVHEPGRDPGDIPNPHVHVLIPMRPLKDDGTWGYKQHREYILDENGNRTRDENGDYIFNAIKNNDWGDPETLIEWRANWAKKVNEAFEQHGISVRVDHRSYVEQGLDLLPQIHEGPVVRAMEKKGIRTDKGDWNRFVRGINSAIRRILGTFKAILDEIEELRKQEAEAKAAAQAEHREFWDAVKEYETEIRQKYTYGHGLVASKKMLKLYEFINLNHISTLDDFKDYVGYMYGKVYDLRHDMRELDVKIAECDRILENVQTLKENTRYYNEWYKISNPKKKAAYKSQHDGELRRYHMAKRELEAKYPDLKIPVKAIMKQRDEYKARYGRMSAQLSEYKKAASQAYAFQKQVRDAHRERKQKRDERSL